MIRRARGSRETTGQVVNFPLTIINLAGSIALLLWGIRMIRTGVQRAFGAQLRGFLAER